MSKACKNVLKNQKKKIEIISKITKMTDLPPNVKPLLNDDVKTVIDLYSGKKLQCYECDHIKDASQFVNAWSCPRAWHSICLTCASMSICPECGQEAGTRSTPQVLDEICQYCDKQSSCCSCGIVLECVKCNITVCEECMTNRECRVCHHIERLWDSYN